jgi:hypothetical protein
MDHGKAHGGCRHREVVSSAQGSVRTLAPTRSANITPFDAYKGVCSKVASHRDVCGRRRFSSRCCDVAGGL